MKESYIASLYSESPTSSLSLEMSVCVAACVLQCVCRRERDYSYSIIVQTYHVELHSLRHTEFMCHLIFLRGLFAEIYVVQTCEVGLQSLRHTEFGCHFWFL